MTTDNATTQTAGAKTWEPGIATSTHTLRPQQARDIRAAADPAYPELLSASGDQGGRPVEPGLPLCGWMRGLAGYGFSAKKLPKLFLSQVLAPCAPPSKASYSPFACATHWLMTFPAPSKRNPRYWLWLATFFVNALLFEEYPAKPAQLLLETFWANALPDDPALFRE